MGRRTIEDHNRDQKIDSLLAKACRAANRWDFDLCNQIMDRVHLLKFGYETTRHARRKEDNHDEGVSSE